MIEICGDYWEVFYKEQPECIVVTTNTVLNSYGQLVMGAGIAKQFKDRYYDLDTELGNRLNKGKDVNGCMLATRYDKDIERNTYIFALCTKRHWKNPSEIELIIDSLHVLKDATNLIWWDKVLMTRPGCGCGGLEWSYVKSQIEARCPLDDRFIVVNK